MNGKKLGFGLMRLPVTDPENNGSIDEAMVCKMVDSFMEAGFTYFDTAAPYHMGNSEKALSQCVVKRYPRDSFTVTDKLSLFMIQKAEELPGFFQGQLERCGVEYFDYYLLHAMDRKLDEKAEEMGAYEFMKQKKAEGRTKHIGFSFHDKAEILDGILTRHPEMEVVQLQLNYIDWEDPEVEAEKCYQVCVKHGKPVIVMEPVKGGLLVNIPREAKALLTEAASNQSAASWAIRFAASQENVFMVLSGMSSQEQMEDNLSYMRDFCPLTSRERQVISQVTEIIRSKETISCTACRYCVEGCPQHIAIPDYFKLMNNISKYGESHRKSARASYAQMTEKHGRASECIKCRKCEGHCPQHLPITRYLEEVAAALE